MGCRGQVNILLGWKRKQQQISLMMILNLFISDLEEVWSFNGDQRFRTLVSQSHVITEYEPTLQFVVLL